MALVHSPVLCCTYTYYYTFRSLFEDEDIDFESQLDRSSEQSQAQFDKSSDMEDLEMQLENLKKDVKKSDLIPFRRDFYVENDVTCNRHQVSQ